MIVAAFASFGCAAERQLYPGAALPRDSVAVVVEPSEISIERIDGKRVRGGEWEILPGDHAIAIETIAAANVNMSELGQSSRIAVKTRCEIGFRADAGHRYVPMRSGGLRGTEQESAEGDLRIWLEDESGQRAAEQKLRCEPSVLGSSHPLQRPRHR
jgi:hypothetical protein